MNSTQMRSSLNQIKSFLNKGQYIEARDSVNALPLKGGGKTSHQSAKRKTSGYQLFVKDELKKMNDNPSLPPTQRIKQAAENWKESSESTKEEYKKRASTLNGVDDAQKGKGGGESKSGSESESE